MQVRQGDILLEQVDVELEDGLEPNETDLVLEGEATGHAHRAEGAEVIDNEDGTRYINVGSGGARLTHDEHGTIELDPGVYQLVRQREQPIVTEVRGVRGPQRPRFVRD